MQKQENKLAKVMVVEDDPELASLLSSLLNLEGYAVSIPVDHQEQSVIRSFFNEHPDIALVDVNLAVGSGLDLVRHIRAEPKLNHICILMTSGLNLKRECIQSGADGFIQKPFMPDELFNLMDKTYQTSINNRTEKE